MIRADEIREGLGQIQFSLGVLEVTRPQPKLRLVNAASARPFTREGISLSGSQVLVAFLSALSSVSLLLWAFLHLWLFGD
jgi:hypothetical protein